MEYTEVRTTIEKIFKALKNGEYEVTIHEANNIWRCTAPDGRTFYKIVDLDDARSSNDFGSCHVDVEGYSFSCEFGNGEYESDFFDEIEDEYVLEDGTVVSKDSLVEEVIDALGDRDDIWFGEYNDTDSQMSIYARTRHIKNPEYYWCEDDDCPIDVDDDPLTAPKDLGMGTVYYNRCKYYLVEEIDEGNNQYYAVHCKEKPDDHGRYQAVLLTITKDQDGKMKVVGCEECYDQYNAVDGCMDY